MAGTQKIVGTSCRSLLHAWEIINFLRNDEQVLGFHDLSGAVLISSPTNSRSCADFKQTVFSFLAFPLPLVCHTSFCTWATSAKVKSFITPTENTVPEVSEVPYCNSAFTPATLWHHNVTLWIIKTLPISLMNFWCKELFNNLSELLLGWIEMLVNMYLTTSSLLSFIFTKCWSHKLHTCHDFIITPLSTSYKLLWWYSDFLKNSQRSFSLFFTCC